MDVSDKTRSPDAPCECINPFQGTSRWYKGNPDHLCPDKGLCYVACDRGCSDQAPTANAYRSGQYIKWHIRDKDLNYILQVPVSVSML